MKFLSLLLLGPAALGQSDLSLRDAISQALSSHPLLTAAAGRVTAAEGLRHQASLRPNPRLNLQKENLRAWDKPAFTYGYDVDTFAYLSQGMETAGKRAKRMELAAAGVRRAELERELTQKQIIARVKAAYWLAAGARRTQDLLMDDVQAFQQVVQYHENRVREGAMAEADLMRIRLERDRRALAANTAALDADRFRIQLFREMGAVEFPAVRFTDSVESGEEPPVLVADSKTALQERTEIKLARADYDRARAGLALQQALSRPDIDFSLGFKRTAGFNTVLGGMTMPLAFANRNQGNIAAASSEIRAAEASLAAAEATVLAEVAAARNEVEIRRLQLTGSLRSLREDAAASARVAQAAYREGGADLLRLLDAERVNLEIQLLYQQALAQYRHSVAVLEAAMGTP